MNLFAAVDGERSLDLTSLLSPTVIVVLLALAALAVVAMIIGGVYLLRRRTPPRPLTPSADRAWRRACKRERREAERIPRRLRAAPRRWLVVGPDNHGKSRLLTHLGARPRRPAGANTPRWWTSGRVAYLETPPSLLADAAQDDDIRWLLAHLRRTGDAQLPLHGVLLVLDLRALLDDPSSALSHAEQAEAQLVELTAAAGLEVPIVLVLTHLDQIPGAAPLAGTGAIPDIVATTRAAAEDGPSSLSQALLSSIDERQAELLENLLPSVYAGRSSCHAASVLRLHRSLTELKPSLKLLLRRLCQRRGLAAPPRVRAIALTGASAGGIASALGDLLPRLSREARLSRRRLVVSRARSALVSLLALAGAVVLYQRGSNLLRADENTLRSTLELVEARPAPEPLDPRTGERLAQLAERWHQRGWDPQRRHLLAEAIVRYLDAAIVTSFIEPSTEALARNIATLSSLDRAASGELQEGDVVTLRDDLENYLRLTSRTSSDPCASLPPPGALAVDEPQATLDLLRRREWPMSAAPPRDEALIAAARRALGDVEAPRLLDWIINDVESSTAASPISARQLSPGRLFVPRDLTVRSAYTRASWPLVQKKIGEWAGHARCWSADPNALTTALRTTYARRYSAAWSTFSDEVRVRSPRSLPDAHLVLDGLLEPSSAPLTGLQSLLREHTQELETAPTPLSALQQELALSLGEAPSAGATSDAAELAKTFAPLVTFGGLEDYYGHLAALRRHLDAVADDPSKADALREATLAAIADTREAILAASTDKRTRTQLRDLLLPPLESLLGHIADDAGAHLRDAFCDRIARPMRALLDDHYPWDPKASAEVPLRDLDRLLNPRDGLLIGFLTEELQPWLVLEGSRLTPRARGRGARLTLSPEVTRFFAAGLAASDALYVDDTLQVDLAVTLSCTPAIHRVGLSTGEQTLHYTCAGANEQSLRWPGEGDLQGAWVEAHGRGGLVERRRRHGEWGLWRLIEETSERVQHGATTEARIKLHETGLGELPIILRPVASHRPLLGEEELLAPLRDPALMPPRRLFVDQERCADVR